MVGALQVDTGSRWGVYGQSAWVLLLSLPLAARHRHPATAAGLLAAGTLAYAVLTDSDAPFVGAVLAFLIGFYSAGGVGIARPRVGGPGRGVGLLLDR